MNTHLLLNWIFFPRHTIAPLTFALCGLLLNQIRLQAEPLPAEPASVRHLVVFSENNVFAGWPANHGAWIWDGREILVGFATGKYRQQSGHNIEPPYRSVFARSLDGGETWRTEDPDGFVGDAVSSSGRFPDRADFTRSGFMFRGVGNGYHGSVAPKGAFFCSWDRGHSWTGPFAFGALAEDPVLRGMEFTPRTDYIVEGTNTLLVLLSVRAQPGNDKIFCARTSDGARSFQFVSWVVPPSDPHRAVMPSTVSVTDSHYVTAIRRRKLEVEENWVDVYASEDRGQSWSFRSKVGITGDQNGNPPALLRLRDGRLCCFYGNRVRRQLLVRCSTDHGKHWQSEIVLRSDYASVENDADMGYPRALQRADGQVLVFYYWACRDRPQQHIAATIWKP